MKLNNCIEILQASLSGGVFGQETLTEVKFAESFLGTARAVCIKELHPNKNTIHQIYYQSVELIYDENLQEDDCYTLFRYPTVMNINANIDGHQSIGKFKGDLSWKRVHSFAHYQNLKAAQGKRMIVNDIHYVLEPADELVRVFHNADAVRPKTAIGYSIFADPLHELIQFNRQLDEYPITPECMAMVEQYLRQGKFEKYLQRPANVVANGADDLNAAVQVAQ